MNEPDPPAATAPSEPMQFTRIVTGHLAPGASQDVTINIEANVTVAT